MISRSHDLIFSFVAPQHDLEVESTSYSSTWVVNLLFVSELVDKYKKYKCLLYFICEISMFGIYLVNSFVISATQIFGFELGLSQIIERRKYYSLNLGSNPTIDTLSLHERTVDSDIWDSLMGLQVG